MSARVLAVLAGGAASFQSLLEISRGCDFVYAADSGQDVCLRHGFRPHVVVGDFDSLGERLEGVDYRERMDQDFSDCDKLLAEIALIGEVDLVMAGLEGDRFDHVLASLVSIVRSGLNPRILFQQGFGQIVRAGSSMMFEGSQGQNFSVVGLGSAVISSRGAEWEMDHMNVSFDAGASLSNVMGGERVEIEVHDGVALVVLDAGIVSWE